MTFVCTLESALEHFVATSPWRWELRGQFNPAFGAKRSIIFSRHLPTYDRSTGGVLSVTGVGVDENGSDTVSLRSFATPESFLAEFGEGLTEAEVERLCREWRRPMKTVRRHVSSGTIPRTASGDLVIPHGLANLATIDALAAAGEDMPMDAPPGLLALSPVAIGYPGGFAAFDSEEARLSARPDLVTADLDGLLRSRFGDSREIGRLADAIASRTITEIEADADVELKFISAAEAAQMRSYIDRVVLGAT